MFVAPWVEKLLGPWRVFWSPSFSVPVANVNPHVLRKEKWKVVNDHYECTRLGVEWFFCGSKMKWWPEKHTTRGQMHWMFWIGHVSHHLRSHLDAVEFTILYAFACRVEYLNAQMRQTLQYKPMVRLTCLFEKNYNEPFTRSKITKQLAFLINSSTPSLPKTLHNLQATLSAQINFIFTKVFLLSSLGAETMGLQRFKHGHWEFCCCPTKNIGELYKCNLWHFNGDATLT